MPLSCMCKDKDTPTPTLPHCTNTPFPTPLFQHPFLQKHQQDAERVWHEKKKEARRLLHVRITLGLCVRVRVVIPYLPCNVMLARM